MREKIRIKHNEKKVTNNKIKIILILAIFIISIILIYYFLKNDYKNLNFGNNMSNKSVEEIEEYILNISSYEAEIEVSVESNKNKNNYKLTQKYSTPNISKQVVVEPSNIAGIETIYDGNKLTINNSKLNLSTIYENYNYIVDNFLWLNSFIEDYKMGKEKGLTSLEAKNDLVIMETKTKNEDNKYICYKKLYIDKKTCKPTKLTIQDVNKKNHIYILYNEITVNGLQSKEVLAFKLDYTYKMIS